MPGSSGSLLPATEVRLINADGQDIEEYDVSGEILLKSPSLIQGYLHDDQSNLDLFTQDGWLRTGDVGLFRVSPAGVEHLFVVDRTKDLIKVKVSFPVQCVLDEPEAHLSVAGTPSSTNGDREPSHSPPSYRRCRCCRRP